MPRRTHFADSLARMDRKGAFVRGHSFSSASAAVQEMAGYPARKTTMLAFEIKPRLLSPIPLSSTDHGAYPYILEQSSIERIESSTVARLAVCPSKAEISCSA